MTQRKALKSPPFRGMTHLAPVTAHRPNAVIDELRGIGDALAAIGRQAGLSNEDVAAMEEARDKMAAEPMRFEP